MLGPNTMIGESSPEHRSYELVFVASPAPAARYAALSSEIIAHPLITFLKADLIPTSDLRKETHVS